MTYLIQHGADPYNLKCQKTGKSAMDIAIQNQEKAVARKKKLMASGKTKGLDEWQEWKVVETIKKNKQIYFHP